MVASTQQNDTTTAHAAFEIPSLEETTQRMRELNERMTVSSRSAVLTALDTFEQALQSVGELEKKAASATQLSWISAAATTHANFVSEVGAQYATAVRGLLK